MAAHLQPRSTTCSEQSDPDSRWRSFFRKTPCLHIKTYIIAQKAASVKKCKIDWLCEFVLNKSRSLLTELKSIVQICSLAMVDKTKIWDWVKYIQIQICFEIFNHLTIRLGVDFPLVDIRHGRGTRAGLPNLFGVFTKMFFLVGYSFTYTISSV